MSKFMAGIKTSGWCHGLKLLSQFRVGVKIFFFFFKFQAWCQGFGSRANSEGTIKSLGLVYRPRTYVKA